LQEGERIGLCPPRSGGGRIPSFGPPTVVVFHSDHHSHEFSSTMKSLIIAFATAKEAIRQPAFFVLAFIAGSSLVGSIFVSYFTFGEDIKMYKDTGLTTISFACLLLALLTSSSTVAEETEGKTAIMLLSKPINRRQFIVGKFLGIELGVLALFVL